MRSRITLAVLVSVAITGGVAAVAAEAVSAAQVSRPGPSAPRPRAPAPSTTKPAPKSKPARARTTARRTSCTSVAHIGDSTSVDLISSAFLANPAQRLPARYSAVGVKHLRIDASTGRSIVEALPGQVSGYNVAKAWRAAGYQGCWVFALGTNDAANVAGGSATGYAARISEMMSEADGQPVMWVNTVTTSAFWATASEQAWDKALITAAASYPNMRIFDWAAVARPAWFLPDGIHYTLAGCAARAKAIADALALAFPANGHSNGVIVK